MVGKNTYGRAKSETSGFPGKCCLLNCIDDIPIFGDTTGKELT